MPSILFAGEIIAWTSVLGPLREARRTLVCLRESFVAKCIVAIQKTNNKNTRKQKIALLIFIPALVSKVFSTNAKQGASFLEPYSLLLWLGIFIAAQGRYDHDSAYIDIWQKVHRERHSGKQDQPGLR